MLRRKKGEGDQERRQDRVYLSGKSESDTTVEGKTAGRIVITKKIEERQECSVQYSTLLALNS